jgi:hypothetical protein
MNDPKLTTGNMSSCCICPDIHPREDGMRSANSQTAKSVAKLPSRLMRADMCPGYVGRDLGSDGKLLDVQCLSRARRHLQLARRMCEIAGPRMRCLLFSQGPKCLAISTLFASVQRIVRETQYAGVSYCHPPGLSHTASSRLSVAMTSSPMPSPLDDGANRPWRNSLSAPTTS